MKQHSLSKTIKSVTTKTFALSLLERPSGRYYISRSYPFTELTKDTTDILDYNLATETFQHLLHAAEGN